MPHLADVPAPTDPPIGLRLSGGHVLCELGAPHAVRLRPQRRVAERVRHAHHDVFEPREECLVAPRTCHLLLGPRRLWPVLQPLLGTPELRRFEQAAAVQHLADPFAQPIRDVRPGEDVPQVSPVSRVERVVLVRRLFCTHAPDGHQVETENLF